MKIHAAIKKITDMRTGTVEYERYARVIMSQSQRTYEPFVGQKPLWWFRI